MRTIRSVSVIIVKAEFVISGNPKYHKTVIFSKLETSRGQNLLSTKARAYFAKNFAGIIH